MTYIPLPKNIDADAVLVERKAKIIPDYSILSTDSFPTPGISDEGSTLEHTDTGDRFRWSGDAWFQTHTIATKDVNTVRDSVEDLNNSTTTPLLASAVFTGTATNVLGYSNVTVQLYSDEASVADGMQFQLSVDGTNWDEVHNYTLDADTTRRFQLGIHAKYFRVVYENDSTDQTEFRVQTILHKNQPITTIHRLSDDISDDNSATLVIASLTARTPGGTHTSIDATNGSNLKVSLEEFDGTFEDNPLPVVEKKKSRTAFGEDLTGQLHPQFQGSFEYTVGNTDLNTNTEVNSGTVTQASGMAVMTTSTTTASSALFQSKRHARYKSGLGGVLRFTALFAAPVAVTEQLFGLADEVGSSEAFENGYIIGYIGTVFGFHRYRSDTVVTVPIASWDDPLDGTGPSGMTIVPTNLNVFFIQYQYLGAGAIRIYVESDTTGGMVLVHTINYTNNNIEPSTHNPNFHHTMLVDNKGTTDSLIVKSSSYAYFVEGKTELIELHQPINSSGIKEKTIITTEVAIFTIRNKSTYASKTNFIDILLLSAVASIEASSANNLGNVRLVKNATLGGVPSYADIHATNSVVEIDVAGTTVAGGIEIDVGPLAGKNDKYTDQALVGKKIILAPGETVTFAGASANSATIDAALMWRELF